MTRTTFRIPVLSDHSKLLCKVHLGGSIGDREVLLSCVANTPTEQNVEIEKWPKYRRNGIPSKFLHAGEPGDVQTFPKLALPETPWTELEIHLESNVTQEWTNWKIVLTSELGSGPVVWVLDVGGNK